MWDMCTWTAVHQLQHGHLSLPGRSGHHGQGCCLRTRAFQEPSRVRICSNEQIQPCTKRTSRHLLSQFCTIFCTEPCRDVLSVRSAHTSPATGTARALVRPFHDSSGNFPVHPWPRICKLRLTYPCPDLGSLTDQPAKRSVLLVTATHRRNRATLAGERGKGRRRWPQERRPWGASERLTTYSPRLVATDGRSIRRETGCHGWASMVNPESAGAYKRARVWLVRS